jgi:hypothetical protein
LSPGSSKGAKKGGGDRAPDGLPDDVEGLLARTGRLVGARLTKPEPLGGGRRSVVLRVRAEGPPDPQGRPSDPPSGRECLVLKRFERTDGLDTAPWRESAGLRLLPRTADLIAADHDLIVMSDLGTGPTLADVLRGTDPDAARGGATRWAAALGELTAQALPRREAFLDCAPTGSPARAEWPRTVPADGAGRLVEALGVIAPPGLGTELSAVGGLADRGPHDVLSQGDTCPDNALLLPEAAGGVRFVDLEATTVHHAALGAAYVALPFASCWCVFDPPPGLVDRMRESYVGALAPVLPQVAESQFWDREVVLGCAAWVLAASNWLLDGALADDPRVGPPEGVTPSYRELLVGRWRWGARELAEVLPATAELLHRAEQAASTAWGEVPRRGYPAFADIRETDAVPLLAPLDEPGVGGPF